MKLFTGPILKTLPVILFLVFPPALWSIDGYQVIQNSYNRPSGKTIHSLLQMNLLDQTGERRSRIIENWSIKTDEQTTNTVILFHSPATVKDTRFLSLENKNQQDDQWIYLPALGRVRRIAASEENQPFMGTDFTYEDMQSREVFDDTHTLLREEKVNDWECFVIESIPKDPAGESYSKRIQWIMKDTWVPVKGELYDKRGRLLKELRVRRLENVQGFWTIIDTTMENVQTGHATELNIKKLVYDKEVPESLFTVNFLRTGRP